MPLFEIKVLLNFVDAMEAKRANSQMLKTHCEYIVYIS